MLILLSIFNIYKIMEVEMDKLFKLKENNTSVRTEVVAGITTFMTMAYILAVNPSILSASGMDSYGDCNSICYRLFCNGFSC